MAMQPNREKRALILLLVVMAAALCLWRACSSVPPGDVPTADAIEHVTPTKPIQSDTTKGASDRCVPKKRKLRVTAKKPMKAPVASSPLDKPMNRPQHGSEGE